MSARILRPALAVLLAVALAGATGEATAGYIDAVLADGPIAYYRLDELAGPTAANLGTTGAANDGTYVGGVGFDATGALYADADPAASFGAAYPDYVITNPFTSFPGSAISVELWMKTTGSGDGIVSYAPTNPRNNELLLFEPNNLAPHINGQRVNTGVDVNDGRWHHIVATWRNTDGQLEVYRDGVRAFATTGIKAGVTLLGGGSLVLAQEQDTVGGGFDPNQRFIGTLDEVALYDRVLSASEVATHYQAARGSVVAANVEVDATSTWTVTAGGPVPMSILSPPNGGDFQPGIAGDRLRPDAGILLSTVSENGRGGSFGSAEAARADGFDTIHLHTAVDRAGGGGELDINTAIAFFPFEGYWRGGHVDAQGTLVAGRGVGQSMLEHVTAGHYRLRLPGVNSLSDGMLFAIGASNSDRIATTFPLADGSGWSVNTQSNDLQHSSVQDDFSFLFMPYTAAHLAGGLIDRDGSVMASAGDFTIVHAASGQYRLSIPDGSPDLGMLLLTVADDPAAANGFPDDQVLSYQADGDDFLIQARDLPGLGFEDTRFVFAYIDFANPPALPEPTTLALLALGGLGLLRRRRRPN